MYVIKLLCHQGDAFAFDQSGCTDINNATQFKGVVDAVIWLHNHLGYLTSIGCFAFALQAVPARKAAELKS